MATGSEGAFPARTEAKTLRELEEESTRVAKEVKGEGGIGKKSLYYIFCKTDDKKREIMMLVIQLFPKAIFKSVESYIFSF